MNWKGRNLEHRISGSRWNMLRYSLGMNWKGRNLEHRIPGSRWNMLSYFLRMNWKGRNLEHRIPGSRWNMLSYILNYTRRWTRRTLDSPGYPAECTLQWNVYFAHSTWMEPVCTHLNPCVVLLLFFRLFTLVRDLVGSGSGEECLVQGALVGSGSGEECLVQGAL